VTDVAHGLTHSCFLRYDSTIWCSGINESGQLGNGGTATLPTSTAVQVRDSTNAAITDAIALGNGGLHSCAIRADRTVWCWGHNNVCDNGGSQLGNGETGSSDVAVQVVRAGDDQPLTDIVEVYGSFCHTCARDMAGGVWCWGDNFAGQLGDGTTVAQEAAVPVLVAMGGAPFSGATSLTVGDSHNCVRTANDEVFCWGRNQQGQLGNGDTTGAQRAVPTKIDQLTAISVSAGRFHTCAVESDNTISCWGSNKHGRLGNGEGARDSDTLNEFSPIRVLAEIGGSAFTGAAQVEGGAMSCALGTDGTAYCWGMNAYGQTGNAGQFVPAPVLGTDGAPLGGVTRIIGRYHRACAFLVTGELVCWGRNDGGQLGDGTLVNHGLATPGAGPTCP
jgi:alpha-tubulin suppressor-like RCC1 family protein